MTAAPPAPLWTEADQARLEALYRAMRPLEHIAHDFPDHPAEAVRARLAGLFCLHPAGGAVHRPVSPPTGGVYV